ncbi:MAG: hypothetical protein AAGB51_12015 [Planctomycetota bacterium]
MNTQRKVTIGLIVSAVGGLLVQEGILFGGGRPAHAVQTAEPGDGQGTSVEATPEAIQGDEQIADMLASFASDPSNTAIVRDVERPDGAFSTPVAWRTREQPRATADAASTRADIERTTQGLRVTSVMASGKHSYAVINGKLLSEGGTLEGVGSVVEIHPERIRMLIRGELVDIRVRNPRPGTNPGV